MNWRFPLNRDNLDGIPKKDFKLDGGIEIEMVILTI